MGVAVAVLARTRVMSHSSEDPVLASEVEAQLGSSLPLSANGLTEILRVWLFIFLGLPIIWDNSSCGRNTCGARRALFGVDFFSVLQLSSPFSSPDVCSVGGPEGVFCFCIFECDFPWRGLLVIILVSSVLQETGLAHDGTVSSPLHTVNPQFQFIKCACLLSAGLGGREDCQYRKV